MLNPGRRRSTLSLRGCDRCAPHSGHPQDMPHHKRRTSLGPRLYGLRRYSTYPCRRPHVRLQSSLDWAFFYAFGIHRICKRQARGVFVQRVCDRSCSRSAAMRRPSSISPRWPRAEISNPRERSVLGARRMRSRNVSNSGNFRCRLHNQHRSRGVADVQIC
jgi:hypothetical protein